MIATLLLALTPAPAPEHVFVFLRTGPTVVVGEAAQEAMAGHFANMGRLAKEGRLSLAGPFGDPRVDPNDRGLWIFSGAGVEAVAPHADSDPCVEQGVFELELIPLATDWPLEALTGLIRLDEVRGVEAPDGGMGAYVLGLHAGEVERAALDAAIAAGDVLLEGRFAGERAEQRLVILKADDPDAARACLGTHGLDADAWELRPFWATSKLDELPALRAAEQDAVVVLEPHPNYGRMTKRANVFGIDVRGTRDVSDESVRHAATILAEYLDNDEDGAPDNRRVVAVLRAAGAALVLDPETAIPAPEFGLRIAPEGVRPMGWPYRPSASAFDETLLEAWRLVARGYELAYPAIFGARESVLERAIASLEEGAVSGEQVSTRDVFVWALTSRLGLQAQPGRQRQIAGTWKFATPELLRTGLPDVWALLEEPRFRLPRLGPDGTYR